MDDKIKVFEVRRTVMREYEETKDRIIFEFNDRAEWVYKAPKEQTHNLEQLEIITEQLKKLTEQTVKEHSEQSENE